MISFEMTILIPTMDQDLMVVSAVYSIIPYLPGYPYCHNIHGVEITVIKITTHEDWTILGIYLLFNTQCHCSLSVQFWTL